MRDDGSKKRWTEEEIQYLINNYKIKPYFEMATELKRTENGVTNKCVRMGLIVANPVKIGDIFGFLTVVGESSIKTPRGARQVMCECRCGTVKSIIAGNLQSKSTTSCGCQRPKRKQEGLASWNKSFHIYKKAAKNRNLEFSISFEQFFTLASSNCFYCGDTPKDYNSYYRPNGKINEKSSNGVSLDWVEKSWIKKNGIDRVNSDKGYLIDNCVSCCGLCNKMKQDIDVTLFINQSLKINKFQQQKEENKV